MKIQTQVIVRMSKLVSIQSTELATPLWQRAPTRTREGKALHDFMMLIPGFKISETERQNEIMQALNKVFSNYGQAVVYADLNTKLSLLWVSVKPVPGICIEMAQVIRHVIPEALLIAGDNDVLQRYSRKQKRLS